LTHALARARASGSEDGTVRIWRLPPAARDADDGAAGGDRSHARPIATGVCGRASPAAPAPPTSAAAAAAAALADAAAVVLRGHQGSVEALAWCAAAGWLASAGADARICLWAPAGGEGGGGGGGGWACGAALTHGGAAINSLAVTGFRLVAGDDGAAAAVWDLAALPLPGGARPGRAVPQGHGLRGGGPEGVEWLADAKENPAAAVRLDCARAVASGPAPRRL
jgi:WD40 repeat protein